MMLYIVNLGHFWGNSKLQQFEVPLLPCPGETTVPRNKSYKREGDKSSKSEKDKSSKRSRGDKAGPMRRAFWLWVNHAAHSGGLEISTVSLAQDIFWNPHFSHFQAKCDVPVPGIPGTGNCIFFFGGIRMNWYRKKSEKTKKTVQNGGRNEALQNGFAARFLGGSYLSPK